MTARMDDHFFINAPSARLEVVVHDNAWAEHFAVDRLSDRLRQTLAAIAAQFDGALGHANLALANDRFVQDLNLHFRGQNKPTNVLSFPSADEEESQSLGHLGDIVIALETLAREAKRDEKPMEQHFLHLVVHGVLHLLGYDHTIEVDAKEMEALERSILDKLDVPNPYDDEFFELG